MARPDRKLLRLLNDDVCRDLLDGLLSREGPRTQAQLGAALGLNSSTVSRRMGNLEDEGIVRLTGRRGPYELVFPAATRELMEKTAELTMLLAERQFSEAKASRDELRKEGLAGGHLHDRAGEGG
jgi:DNA-binding Lrp family transcriptional regulator